MKHRFTLIYELDTTVAVAVATYLDAEHYIFLHRQYSSEYELIKQDGRALTILTSWHFAGLTSKQFYTAEYVPPARFLNYDLKATPWWIPSIHHVMKMKTDLRYYPDATGEKTVSHLDVELDLPLLLWPFRHVIQRKLEQLKREKDDEDVVMIRRRAKIFGRGNIKSYLMPHQWMLHKDAFVEHFGPRATEAAGSHQDAGSESDATG